MSLEEICPKIYKIVERYLDLCYVKEHVVLNINELTAAYNLSDDNKKRNIFFEVLMAWANQVNQSARTNNQLNSSEHNYINVH